MKQVIMVVTVVVAFLLVAGCSDQYTASVRGGGGIGVRFGNIVDANRIEIGAGAFWLDSERDPESIEIYAIRFGPDIMKVANPFGGPDINGRPYLGASIKRNFDADSTNLSPITGVSLEQFLYAEYDINREESRLGIRRQWRF